MPWDGGRGWATNPGDTGKGDAADSDPAAGA